MMMSVGSGHIVGWVLTDERKNGRGISAFNSQKVDQSFAGFRLVRLSKYFVRKKTRWEEISVSKKKDARERKKEGCAETLHIYHQMTK